MAKWPPSDTTPWTLTLAYCHSIYTVPASFFRILQRSSPTVLSFGVLFFRLLVLMSIFERINSNCKEDKF